MRKTVSNVMLVLLVTSILALAVRISTTAPAEGPAPLPRVLRTVQPTPWYIDPAVGSDLASTSSILNLYDPLVFPNNVGNASTQGPVKPWIATNWTTSADGLTWTFTIRQGVTFHSGRTLNATDVAFSMNRLLTIGQGFAYIFEPYISNATATDQWTVVFNMKEPFGPFLTSLVRLYIVDSTTVTSHIATPGSYGTHGDFGTGWLDTHDAGSGPFTVKENLPEAYLDMIRFSDYWGYMAALAPTEYEVIAEPTSATEYTMMLDKEVEISSAWLPEQTLDALANVSGIYIANIAEPNEYYYMMNLLHPPLDDIHVRKALAYCLDYKTMVSKLYPRNTMATSCVPACVAGYANTTIYQYNVTAAESELRLSKYYPDIINNPDKYAINFYWIAAVPIREQDALYFAADAQAIGLKVNVIAEPWVMFVAGVADPSFSGMANVEVDSDYPEAGSLLASRYSNNSMGTWTQMEWFNDSTFDNMLTTALSTINTTQRYAHYAQLQQYIISNCVGMNICDVPQLTAAQSYVKWPMAQDPTQAVPVMGYNYDGRLIEIESACVLTITATMGGTTNPANGTYTFGTSVVNVTATPAKGYYFDRWQLDGVDAGFDNPITVNMDANHTLHVVFTPMNPGHDIIIRKINTSKTVVGEGCNLTITVISMNIGSFREVTSVIVNASTTSIGQKTVTLDSTVPTTVTLACNTSGLAYGNYTICAHATPVTGEANTTNNDCVDGFLTVTIPGDVNGDFKVSLADLTLLAIAYGSKPGDANWNPNADIDNNGKVGLTDLTLLSIHYGQHYP